MDDHDSVSSYFGPSLDKREAGPDAPLPPAEPVFPDITDLVTTIRSKVKKSKSAEQRIGFIDLGIAELANRKREGEVQFHRLLDQNNLDDPDQYWSYETALDKAINELRILRQRLILEEPEHWASPDKKTEPKASLAQPMPAFAPPQGSTSSDEPRTPPPEVMDVEELAAFLGMSESWIYKNYEAEGIPYFTLGTSLRFRRNKVLEWLDTWGKEANASSGRAPVSRKPRAVRTTLAADEAQPFPSVPKADVPDQGVHPGILSKIEKLASSLYEKGYLSQTDSLRLKAWILKGARLDPNPPKISWLKTRKSLVTCIVLCHYADLVCIPQTRDKTPPRPDFGATIERDFIAEGKSILQNIDRDFAKKIDLQVNAFVNYIRQYADKNELEFSEANNLFSALTEYYDDIDGSEGMAEEAKTIKDIGRDLDFIILRLFHSLSIE
jgi:excisionase family DNA binding protein